MGRPRSTGGVRPTARRVRTALFDHLAPRLAGAAVLDLYAGTGALGLEALRRGARAAVFVERDARLAQQIRDQLRAEGWEGQAQVWRGQVAAALRRLAAEGRQFDLILLDPPYSRGFVQQTVDALAAAPLLRPGGRIVAEGHWRDAPHPPARLACVRAVRYGETGLWEFASKEEISGDDGALSGNL